MEEILDTDLWVTGRSIDINETKNFHVSMQSQLLFITPLRTLKIFHSILYFSAYLLIHCLDFLVLVTLFP